MFGRIRATLTNPYPPKHFNTVLQSLVGLDQAAMTERLQKNQFCFVCLWPRYKAQVQRRSLGSKTKNWGAQVSVYRVRPVLDKDPEFFLLKP